MYLVIKARGTGRVEPIGKAHPVPCTLAGSSSHGDHKGNITLDAQLCFAVYKSANKMSRLYRRYLQPFDLTFPLYLVLLVLWERAPCNVGDIVQALDLETNTVTPLLKRLQRLGYVSRERDPSDERKVTVGLTAQGNDLQDKAVAIRTDFIDRSEIPYDQVIELRTTLHRLSAIIDGLMLSASTPDRHPEVA